MNNAQRIESLREIIGQMVDDGKDIYSLCHELEELIIEGVEMLWVDSFHADLIDACEHIALHITHLHKSDQATTGEVETCATVWGFLQGLYVFRAARTGR